MKVIGLCGGSGSGKGTVAGMFSDYGIPSIDTDAVYHDLTSCKTSCVDALSCEFGCGILNSDGSLNRKELSKVVFFGEESSEKREALNRISHKYVLDKVREILRCYESRGVVAALVDAPLLFESGFDKECDFVIAVIAERDVRIARIVERDGISAEAALRRIESQLPDAYLTERARYTIYNSGNLSETKISVDKIAREILNSRNGE